MGVAVGKRRCLVVELEGLQRAEAAVVRVPVDGRRRPLLAVVPVVVVGHAVAVVVVVLERVVVVALRAGAFALGRLLLRVRLN